MHGSCHQVYFEALAPHIKPGTILIGLAGNPEFEVVYNQQKFSGKSGWKVNGTRLFRSSQRKISESNGTSEVVVVFFPMELIPNGDSCSVPSKPWAIPGRNLPVLNFANHLPTPWTVLFAHVNGKQPESQVRRVLGEKAQQCTIINFDSLPWRCQTTESGVTCEVVHTMDTLLGNMTVTHLLMWLFLSLRYHSSCLSDFPTE